MSPPDLKSQGNDAFKRREFQLAESLYTLAIEAARGSGDTVVLSESLRNRGLCRVKRTLFAEALADFREAFQARPPYSKAWLAAATVHLDNIGDPAAAVTLLQEALLVPGQAEVAELKAKLEYALSKAAPPAAEPGGVAASPAAPLLEEPVVQAAAVPYDALRARLERASVVAATAPPSPREQRFHVARLSAQYDAAGVKAGAEYALVPAAWWEDWAALVGGFSADADIAPVLRMLKLRDTLDYDIDDPAVAEHYPAVAAAAYADASEPEPLRPLDCLALIDLEATASARGLDDPEIPAPVLLGTATEGVNFKVVGLEVFRALAAWHGTRGPAIVRVAVRVTAAEGEGEEALSFAPRIIVDLRPELQRYSQAPLPAPPAVTAATEQAAPRALTSTVAEAAAMSVAIAAAPPAVPSAAIVPAASVTAASKACPRCSAPDAMNKCGRCRSVWYCSTACQREHWPLHKKACAAAAAAAPPPPPAPKVLNGRVGLTNLGNTCFMNSSLQALAATWPLSQVFLSGRWASLLNRENKLGTGGRLAAAYADLLERLWHSPPGTRSIAPGEVKRAIAGFQDRFSGFAQHDAQELLNFLVDGLHEDLNAVTERTYMTDEDMHGRPDSEVAPLSWAKYRARNDSVVADLFAGQLKSTLVCPHCSRVSVSFDPYTMLSLPLPTNPSRNIVALLQRLPYDASLPPRRMVPSLSQVAGAEAINLASAGSPDEADPKREKLWEAHGFELAKTGTVADLRFAVARETGIPPERFVMLWERPGGFGSSDFIFLTPETIPITQLAPKPQPDAFGRVYVYEVPLAAPPLPTEVAAATVGDSATTPAAEAGSAIAVGVSIPEKRILVRVSHLTSASPSADNAQVDPAKQLSAHVVFRDTSKHGPPTVFGLPQSASVAVLRVALARAILPVLHRERIRALLGCSADDSDDLLVWRLAQELPLMRPAVRVGPAASWLPSFGDDICDTPADARTLPLKDALNVTRLAPGDVVEVCVAWRGRFAAVLAQKRLTEASASPSLLALQSAVERSMSSRQAGISLSQCFDVFTQPETLDEKNTWYCSACKDHVMATKTLQVWTLPEVLVVHLKRFEARNIVVRDKLDTLVSCPLTGLDLTGFDLKSRGSPGVGASTSMLTSNGVAAGIASAAASGGIDSPGPSAVYDCYAVVNHYGQMFGGHYTAFVNHDIARSAPSASPIEGGQWLEMDDATVTPVKAADVVTPAAYVLFYRLRQSPVGSTSMTSATTAAPPTPTPSL